MGRNNEGYYDSSEYPSDNGGYANYSDLKPNESLDEVLHTVVIHHEGNFQTNSVFLVQLRHMLIDGYADIRYHYAVGRDGTIYEGRYIGARGAHVHDTNTGMIGVLLLGDYHPGWEIDSDLVGKFTVSLDIDNDRPSSAQVYSTIRLVGWLDYKFGINEVVGHKDVNTTICPGKNALPYIDIFNSAAGGY